MKAKHSPEQGPEEDGAFKLENLNISDIGQATRPLLYVGCVRVFRGMRIYSYVHVYGYVSCS